MYIPENKFTAGNTAHPYMNVCLKVRMRPPETVQYVDAAPSMKRYGMPDLNCIDIERIRHRVMPHPIRQNITAQGQITNRRPFRNIHALFQSYTMSHDIIDHNATFNLHMQNQSGDQ
jgi:hypothetical protein